ncbi:hypothetical protein D3C81_1911490 [compost metagenome]
MWSLFKQSSILQNKDLVRLPNCIQPVSNHKAGSSLHQALKTFLNLDLGNRIDAARCFIEYKDRRTRQNGPGNG